MAKYKYSVVVSGVEQKGEITASSESDALEKVNRMYEGFRVLEVSVKETADVGAMALTGTIYGMGCVGISLLQLIPTVIAFYIALRFMKSCS
jgi:hypothetical protein